ncbi:MAG: class I SAM-dependent methyltransferase [Planctomycetota bacterium]|nr:MAG: class I SAM-dependent methyltransferase [Planctomycetota bacterium]
MKLWSLGGGPGHLPYAVYDYLRDGLNRRLADYLVRALARHRPGVRAARVLEAGAGPGSASSVLRERGLRAATLDLDGEACRVARRRDPALWVVRGDLYALPFAAGAFDLVWSSSTIEHFADPDPIFAEMVRVTAPGGLVFVGAPLRSGPLEALARVPPAAVGEWVGRRTSCVELAARLARHGVEPLEDRVYFFRFFVGVLGRVPRRGRARG